MEITSTIEHWFDCKGKKDYATHNAALGSFLNPKHESVVASANYQELIKTGAIVYLNDHGPKHIKTVENRALQLMKSQNLELNPKEFFYLLNAIQIHDIGNIYGRTNHVTDVKAFLPEIKPILNVDDIELKYIRQIAEAHGGELADGDKDKISMLSPIVNTDNVEVRQQLIASILRFADELADEKTRCDRHGLENNLIPPSSEVFHAYSYCLDCTLIKHEHKTIELKFNIPKEFAVREFGKGTEKIHLIDEIYNRILKMHYERIYASRFWKGFIDLDRIWVKIEFYSSYLDDFVCDPITFEVKEMGYPSAPSNGLYSLCKELTINGQQLNGQYIANKINETT